MTKEQPANILEWANRSLDIRLWPTQAKLALETFGEWCPVCTDHHYWEHMPASGGWRVSGVGPAFAQRVTKNGMEMFLTHVALLEHGKCPKCGLERKQAIKTRHIQPIQEVLGFIGQRGGSTVLSVVLGTYLIHKLRQLGDIATAYGLIPEQQIEIAVIDDGGLGTLWDVLNEKIRHCLADDQPEDPSVVFIDKSLVVRRYSAGNPDQLRGVTRVAALIDTLAWIDADADEILAVLDNSLLTMRHESVDRDVPTPLLVALSSPRGNDDALARRLVQKAGHKNVLKCCLPTWNINPHHIRDDFAKELQTPNGRRDYAIDLS